MRVVFKTEWQSSSCLEVLMELINNQMAIKQMSKTVLKEEMSQNRKLFTMTVTKVEDGPESMLSPCYRNEMNVFAYQAMGRFKSNY